MSRKVILIDGKAVGKFNDESGNFDQEKYQLASATLSYIHVNAIGMNDGRDFVDECLSTDECRAIFEMIFEEMKQKQHYEMMMQN